MPVELIRRLAIGLGVAGVVAGILWFALARHEARADRRHSELRIERTEHERLPRVVLPGAMPQGTSRSLTLATSERGMDRRIAPIVEVRRGGSVQILRGAPAPSGPGVVPDWNAGIVLPRTEFARLDPRERAALLEIVRAWGGDAAFGIERLRLVDVILRRSDWDDVARWRR